MIERFSDLLIILFVVAFAWIVFLIYRRIARFRHLQNYQFPEVISCKVAKQYPHLSAEQLSLVMEGLREYFLICFLAGRRMVSMPSQVVDVAWHEFILFTRVYEQFCRRHLGRFLHHVPAEAMSSPTLAQDGIKRAWRLACAREKIDRMAPKKLPLLFAIDKQLAIPDGFTYSLNCQKPGDAGYCAGHIGCGGGCSSGCGGDSGCGGGGCGGD